MEHNMINNLVNGVNLQKISTAVIDIDRKDNLLKLESGDIIWCKPEYISDTFDILKDSDKTFKFIISFS